MSGVLHLVQKPCQKLDQNLDGRFAPGDAVVFMGQCVTELPAWLDAGLGPGVNCHVLTADCELFGVNPELPGVQAVDYPGLVDLVNRYPLCQSW